MRHPHWIQIGFDFTISLTIISTHLLLYLVANHIHLATPIRFTTPDHNQVYLPEECSINPRTSGRTFDVI